MHETLASKVILVLFGPPCALAATGCAREHGFASCRLWTPIAVYISVSLYTPIIVPLLKHQEVKCLRNEGSAIKHGSASQTQGGGNV